MALKKIKVKPKDSRTTIENYIYQLHNLKKQLTDLGERKTELESKITKYVEANITPDAKKHYTYRIPQANGTFLVFQRQARRKVSLDNETALEILRKKKLKSAIIEVEKVAEEVTQDQIIDALLASGYNSYIDVETKADENVLEQLVMDGKITEKEFEKMCTVDIKYATLCYEAKEEDEE